MYFRKYYNEHRSQKHTKQIQEINAENPCVETVKTKFRNV
jgi:hypothetical protein